MDDSNQFETARTSFFSRFFSHHHALMEVTERVSTKVQRRLSDSLVDRDRWEYVKVREIMQELERAGWVQIRQTGSHRHYKHDTRTGSVCVAGNLGDDVPKGTLGNSVRQAGLERRPR
jgi:predicted RNA binding protein YcfA (HicA-like mRNA interferase family)